MKRHESLAPLSREHHSALILAQLLKKGTPAYKGLPSDIPGKIKYAMGMFNGSLKEHFRKEELLIEKVRHCHADIERSGADIIAEHEHLATLFLNLDRSVNPVDSMDHLGNFLDMHIRKEERVLFPLVQQHCPEEVLKEIEHLLNENETS